MQNDSSEGKQKEISCQEAYERFFCGLCQEGLEPLVRAASELFSCPVLLTDENYRLICQYPSKKLELDIWDTLYDVGTLPMETIWEYENVFLKNPSQVYEPFYADFGPAEAYPRIFGEIYTKKNYILGHIAIFMMGRRFRPGDLDVAKIFIDALRIRMEQRAVRTKSRSAYLLDLLDAEVPPQRKLFAERILSEQLHGNFGLMAIPAGTTAGQKAFAGLAVNHLNSSFSHTVSTLYRSCIVTLFGNLSGSSYTERETQLLLSAASSLPQAYTNAGISEPFQKLSDACVYYMQAYLVSCLKHKEPAFFFQYASDTLFIPALQLASAETYLHPLLSALNRYDKENGSCYFETLRAYSLSMHNREAASKELHIHRNTLLYRLNRIQDMFQIALEDPNTARYLLNSFQIWDLAQR